MATVTPSCCFTTILLQVFTGRQADTQRIRTLLNRRGRGRGSLLGVCIYDYDGIATGAKALRATCKGVDMRRRGARGRACD
jgi:hypothetical protein